MQWYRFPDDSAAEVADGGEVVVVDDAGIAVGALEVAAAGPTAVVDLIVVAARVAVVVPNVVSVQDVVDVVPSVVAVAGGLHVRVEATVADGAKGNSW